MSFLEFWGERTNPGQVGSVEIRAEHDVCRCRPLVWARFILVMLAIPALWGVGAFYIPLPLWQALTLVVGSTLIYVALSYSLDPKPDTENLGWAGGLIDDPLRYSDDLNRSLMSLKILLGPGRFVAESVADMFIMDSRPKEVNYPRSY